MDADCGYYLNRKPLKLLMEKILMEDHYAWKWLIQITKEAVVIETVAMNDEKQVIYSLLIFHRVRMKMM